MLLAICPCSQGGARGLFQSAVICIRQVNTAGVTEERLVLFLPCRLCQHRPCLTGTEGPGSCPHRISPCVSAPDSHPAVLPGHYIGSSGCRGKKWCRRRDLNPRPTHYECVALPAELLRHTVYAFGFGRDGVCKAYLDARFRIDAPSRRAP